MNTRPALRTVFPALLLWWCAAAHAEQYAIPLFVAPGPGGDPQGVLRLANDSDAAVAVSIHAIDDAGNRAGPATLTLGAAAAVELTATELRSGSAAKGLAAGLGPLAGNVRLRIDSDAPIVPSAYVRDAGGALAAMNSTVLGAASPRRAAGAEPDGYRYDVTLFHPASNLARESRLRLINPGDAEAQVAIAARDDTGNPAPGGPVRLTLPAGGGRTLTARQLEAGDGASLTGGLGAGVGNWRLSVSSDRPIEAVNVTVGAAGDWRNLSTTAADGWAPQDTAAFEARFVNRAIVIRDGSGYRGEFHVLVGNRIRISDINDGIVDSNEGGYRYVRTGRETARMLIEYDDGGVGCMYLHFSAAREGWYSAACTETADPAEYLGGGTWVALDSGAPRLDLGPGLEDMRRTAGSFLWLTLPEAVGGGDGELSYSLSPEVPGLAFDPLRRELGGRPSEPGHFLMTYRVRDASGDADWRYFNIRILDPFDPDATSYEAGDTLTDIPAGDWRPEAISGGSSHASENGSIVQLGEGGYVASSEHRYTCYSLGGCVVENRRVTSGRIVQTLIPSLEIDRVERFELSDDFAHATAIAYANGQFHVVDSGRDKVFAYTASGERDPAADFELASDNGSAEGIVYANSRFHVVDWTARKVFAYTASGDHDAAADWDLPRFENFGPTGIAYANDRFHVVDTRVGKVYAYTSSGERDPAADFDLAGNRIWVHPGIAYADGRFHVLNTGDYKAHAYTASGERDAAADFDFASENFSPTGIAYADGRFHIVSRSDDKVYAYTASGDHDAAADFELADDPRESWGIAFANDRLYVTDYWAEGKVYAYTVSGERDAAADFDLDNNNDSPRGIVYANGRFQVVNYRGIREVYAYTASGERDAAADFSFVGNGDSSGITYANGRFHIVDWVDERVYAYTASGERDPAADFDLTTDNSALGGIGIAFANGRFHIVDRSDRRVYAYTASGERDPAADFDLVSDNQLPDGIAYANGWFYVIDGFFDHVFAYRATGDSAGTDGIAAGTSPSFADVAGPGDRTYVTGTAIATLELPAANGGDGALTYSLAPSVPGLTFGPATRRLSGTPTRAGTYDMTYTATDADGDSDSLRFTVAVEQQPTTGGGGPTRDGDCYVGLLVNSGESCTYPGTSETFSVTADGRGRFIFFSSGESIDIANSNINGRLYDIAASHQGDGVWQIDRVGG